MTEMTAPPERERKSRRRVVEAFILSHLMALASVVVGGIWYTAKAQERLERSTAEIAQLKQFRSDDRELLVRVDATTLSIRERLDRMERSGTRLGRADSE